MYENYSDQEIIELHKQGNLDAFGILVNRYSKPIYNFAKRLNKNNTEDITQEIFIKIWKKINSFDDSKASFKTWLFTIARNTIIDFSRKKRLILFSDIHKEDDEKEVEFYENIPDEKILPDKILERLDDVKVLNTTLEQLNTKYKEVILLHYYEEMTFEEIGKVLNKSTNTIKSQHRRALLQIKEILENAPKY